MKLIFLTNVLLINRIKKYVNGSCNNSIQKGSHFGGCLQKEKMIHQALHSIAKKSTPTRVLFLCSKPRTPFRPISKSDKV